MAQASDLARPHSTSTTTPPSPLGPYTDLHRSGAQLRTGYTHLFTTALTAEDAAASDRSAAMEFRERCRRGEHQAPTSGEAPGFVQANLVALPKAHAFDFLTFCLKNPKACPLLAVTEPGDPSPSAVATGANLATDVPKYRVWRDGELAEERTDVSDLWGEDMVGFLLGCSFSWEPMLAAAGLTPRHLEGGDAGVNVPMYKTNLPNTTSGPFGGELVVSMRPYAPEKVAEVAAITSEYPGAHGGPVHWGDAAAIGIDPAKVGVDPDWGDAVAVAEGEVPVWWACGVTPQTALMAAKLPLAITHAPGYMFVCDLQDHELRVPAT